jgi:AraC family transcriptional regulator
MNEPTTCTTAASSTSSSPDGRAPGALSLAALHRVRHFVLANLERRLRLRDLAASARLSPHHFARAFKVRTRETPRRFVLRARLDQAERLLRDPARSLADVALAAGFSSQSQLTTAFGAARGVTPGRYRRTLERR